MAAVPSPASALEPTSGNATVVFLRPSGLGSLITFMMIDQNGHSLAIRLRAGIFQWNCHLENICSSLRENTAVMHANLAPNDLYYIEVDPKMGVFSARVGLQPIKPGSKAWREVPEKLGSTKRFVPIVQAGQAKLMRTPAPSRRGLQTRRGNGPVTRQPKSRTLPRTGRRPKRRGACGTATSSAIRCATDSVAYPTGANNDSTTLAGALGHNNCERDSTWSVDNASSRGYSIFNAVNPNASLDVGIALPSCAGTQTSRK